MPRQPRQVPRVRNFLGSKVRFWGTKIRENRTTITMLPMARFSFSPPLALGGFTLFVTKRNERK